MTTLAEQSTSASPMSNVNACYDPDIDSFINLDQLTYTSADSARPKAALVSQPSVAGSDSSASDIGSATLTASQPIPFQGPSHQYDDHKQQTPLPPGGLAHAMAFSNTSGMNFTMGAQGFAMNGNMYAGMNVKHEETPIDFGSVPTRNPSEMDLDFFSHQPNRNQFVDPNALGGHELSPVGPPAQVGRMYPGMHQQQAAMAKAQQQRQHEMMRQQQQQQQQHLQQRRMEEQARQAGRQTRPNRHPDPVVEERISRLLQQMRQSSVASQEEIPQPATVLPQMAKAKKDEEEMDEDERLLASEEGKKLSSKERRQLRNKVSARAFRSRRKEYISQLEGEVAAKTNEANDLRMQNRALFEENARLTDLTRMLLSSPHFASFLNDLSVNGVPQSQPQQPHQVPPQAVSQPPMQQSTQKDVNPSRVAQEFQMQQSHQVGMVMVPEQSVVPTMDMHPGGWNSGIDMNFTNAPVFAVFEVPEPVIDTDMLCGKSSNFVGSPALESSKDEVPYLERPPVSEPLKEQSSAGTPNPDVEIDESDPAFALFLDSPPASQSSSTEQSQELFGGIESEKALSTYQLVVEDESTEVSAAAMHRFERLCQSMEAVFQRVSMVTSHLV